MASKGMERLAMAVPTSSIGSILSNGAPSSANEVVVLDGSVGAVGLATDAGYVDSEIVDVGIMVYARPSVPSPTLDMLCTKVLPEQTHTAVFSSPKSPVCTGILLHGINGWLVDRGVVDAEVRTDVVKELGNNDEVSTVEEAAGGDELDAGGTLAAVVGGDDVAEFGKAAVLCEPVLLEVSAAASVAVLFESHKAPVQGTSALQEEFDLRRGLLNLALLCQIAIARPCAVRNAARGKAASLICRKE